MIVGNNVAKVKGGNPSASHPQWSPGARARARQGHFKPVMLGKQQPFSQKAPVQTGAGHLT